MDLLQERLLSPTRRFCDLRLRQRAVIRGVADRFTEARLLTTNESAGVTTIEVSHEALIREWERLGNWLKEARYA